MSGRKRTQWNSDTGIEYLRKSREMYWDQQYFNGVILPFLGLNLDEHGSARKVLDVGCGLGFLTEKVAERAPFNDFIGIDTSDLMIRQVKEYYSDHENFLFEVADATDLPFPNDSFDVVMGQTVLMHIPNVEKAITEIIRVTKPKGRIWFLEPDHSFAEIGFSSTSDLSPGEKSLIHEVYSYAVIGRKQHGFGDWGIGSKLPIMFHEYGLRLLRVSIMDTRFLITRETPREVRKYHEYFIDEAEKYLDEPRFGWFKAALDAGMDKKRLEKAKTIIYKELKRRRQGLHDSNYSEFSIPLLFSIIAEKPEPHEINQ